MFGFSFLPLLAGERLLPTSSDIAATNTRKEPDQECDLVIMEEESPLQKDLSLIRRSYILTPQALYYVSNHAAYISEDNLVTNDPEEIKELQKEFCSTTYPAERVRKTISTKNQDSITSITGHTWRAPPENELERAKNRLVSTAKIYGITTSNCPLLRNFIPLTDHISSNYKAYQASHTDEVNTLNSFTNSAVLKIKQPYNEANNKQFGELMEKLDYIAEDRAKHHHPLVRYMCLASIYLAGIVAEAAIVTTFVIYPGLLVCLPLALLAFTAPLLLTGLACHLANKHFEPPRLYAKLNNTNILKEKNFSFFMPQETNNEEKLHKIPTARERSFNCASIELTQLQVRRPSK